MADAHTSILYANECATCVTRRNNMTRQTCCVQRRGVIAVWTGWTLIILVKCVNRDRCGRAFSSYVRVGKTKGCLGSSNHAPTFPTMAIVLQFIVPNQLEHSQQNRLLKCISNAQCHVDLRTLFANSRASFEEFFPKRHPSNAMACTYILRFS